MSNELVKIEDISESNAPAIYIEGGLDQYVKMASDKVSSVVPDLTTAKGRAAIATLAAKVSSSKVAVDDKGKSYLKRLKAQPKIIEKELREFREKMDALRDKTREPLTLWEGEQKAIEAKKLAEAEAEKLALQVEADHEIAILLDEKHDRELEEARLEAKRRQEEYEQKLKDEAAAKAEAEKLEAIKREAAAKEAARISEENRIASEARARQAEIDAEARHIEQAKQAESARIEAEKQAKINAGIAAENARIAEQNRVIAEAKVKADELAELEANKAHVGSKRREAKESIMSLGIDEATAKKIVLAVCKGSIANISISYQ